MEGQQLYDLQDPEKYSCTDVIDLKNYFHEYSELIGDKVKPGTSNLSDQQKDELIFSSIDISLTREEKNNIIQLCNPDSLTVYGEIPQERNQEKITQTLVTSAEFDTHNASEDLKIIKCKESWRGQFARIDRFTWPKTIVETEDDPPDLVPFKDTILQVSVYHTFKFRPLTKLEGPIRIRNTSHHKCSHEITLLASHTLADLRDKILCITDMGCNREIYKPDESESYPSTKDIYPSGFIFIENTFYNDFRSENAIDYSAVIREWAQTKGIANFQTGDIMTRITDINIRFGLPYLYQHQGDCEHLLLFTNAHLLDDRDSLHSSRYPIVDFTQAYYGYKCVMCTRIMAKYLVADCERLPNKYSFFCKDCLLSYNYMDGVKIGNFKVYPFLPNTNIVEEEAAKE